MENWNKIEVELDEYLKENKISRSSLTRKTGLQYSQILKYCRKDIQRIDLNVLAKICTVLNCNIEDILKINKQVITYTMK